MDQRKVELWKAQYVARVSKYRNRIAKLNKCPKHMSQLLVRSVSLDLDQQDKRKNQAPNTKRWKNRLSLTLFFPLFFDTLFLHFSFVIPFFLYVINKSFLDLSFLRRCNPFLALGNLFFFFLFSEKKHKTCKKNAAKRCNLYKERYR